MLSGGGSLKGPMRNLRRSLRYLRGQRGRILLSFGCAAVASVLWAGGLAAILPGAKVLLSDEGLHGWAFRQMASDRLAARIEFRAAPRELQAAGKPMALVVRVGADTPLAEGLWLTGLAGQGGQERPMAGLDLARAVAIGRTGEAVELLAHDPSTGRTAPVAVVLRDTRPVSKLLSWLAVRLPEPADYAGRFPLLVWLLVLILSLTVLRGLIEMLHEYLTGSAVMRATVQMRLDTYSSALCLPVAFYSTEGSADSMSRMLYDTAQVAGGQSLLVSKLVIEPAKLVAATVVALALSWKLTLLAMIGGPAMVVVIRQLGRMMRRLSRHALRTFAELTAILQETLGGIRVVKAYTMEGSERKRFLQTSKKLLGQRVRMMVLDSLTGVVVEVLSTLAGMLAIAAAAWLVFRAGDMEPDTMLALMACLGGMFNSVRKLARVVPSLQTADAAAKRVLELQDLPREPRTPLAPTLPRHSRDVAFEGVSFRYAGASRDVLRDVNLTVHAGQTVAIVGPNGAGKTTLVSLLPRLIEPTAGRVLIDGRDIARHSVRSVRRQIALVPQETVVFQASVRDNIAYGMRRPSDADVMDAARRAYVDEFVRELPEGYDTIVGPGGATLSGGQRQRIAIARAILRKPAILVFDEALSHVDSESETRIRQAMSELIASCTTFLIAHSFATVQWADRIVVMHAGRVIDTGRHDELLAGCELYRNLYNTQLSAYREPVA